MKKCNVIFATILIVLLCSSSFSADKSYAKRAAEFAEISKPFSAAMGSYLSRDLRSVEDELERIKIEHVFLIANNTSTCALLGGNLVGSLSMMDKQSQRDFAKMATQSLELCSKNISMHKSILAKYANDGDSSLPKRFSQDLIERIETLEKHLELRN